MSSDTILIVGSGFAGLCMGIRLKQAGIDDFVILERAGQVGGTWRDNTYPGIACDVPSYLYSYSFEPSPRWSRFFAPQKEILAYLEHCATRYGIREHIRFHAAVKSARFDEGAGLWTVETADGQQLTGRALVSGAGHALSRPVYPDIAGRETFQGKTFHSARWDHSSSLEGKAVAVVGTGASAVQIIPSIGKTVGRMHVFQRTAAWVMPKPDRPIPAKEQELFRKHPALQKLARGAIYSIMEAMAVGYVVEPRLNAIREHRARRFLKKSVADPELRARLTPDFRLGCKRVLFADDYYATLCQPNVELVTDPIAEIRPRSVVTRDGKERPVDVIVYATGFEAAEVSAPYALAGRGGLDLDDAWKAAGGIQAYLGTTVSGFPNFFLIEGPNTGLGHSSMILMIESQVAYILDAIRTMRRDGLKSVEVLPETQARYNEKIQQRLARTVWNTGGCVSWYLTRAGKNTTAWPGFTWEFRLRTRRFDVKRYATERLGAEQPARAASRAAQEITARPTA